MYQGFNEKTEEMTPSFMSEDELLNHIDNVSIAGDFWDVMRDGRIEYYYSI